MPDARPKILLAMSKRVYNRDIDSEQIERLELSPTGPARRGTSRLSRD